MICLEERIIDIKNLHIWYKVFEGNVKVLNGVNFHVGKGEKVALVGETGCGKTTTVKSILNILPKQASVKDGEILFKNKNVLTMNKSEIRDMRGKGISMIFQDPTFALNPVFTIGEQMDVVIENSGLDWSKDKRIRREMAIKAIVETSLPDADRILSSYPFQLSGGMRQRICIAMSLSTPRDLVIADEPTTNLDVTIQDQVLRILKERVENKESSLILITHSLGVARETSDRIYVMYAGNMIETARTGELFKNQFHPYTMALMECIPKLTGGGMAKGIPGRIPNYLEAPSGCRFWPRCKFAKERCRNERPGHVDVGNNHTVACFLYY